MTQQSGKSGVLISAVLALAGCVTIVSFTVHRVTQGDAAVRSVATTPGVETSNETNMLTPVATPSPTAEPTPTHSAENGQTERLRRMLARVPVVARRPNVAGYDRSCSPGAGCSFGTAWSDDTTADLGHNGCDTRNDVLRQQLSDIVIDPDTNGCVVRSGILNDPYTGRRIDFLRGFSTSRAVEVDHVIPLAAAWDLGAWKWTQERRNAFANDVTHELLAVDGPTNQQKSDSTPASWLPPNDVFWCQYAIRYLEASLHWKLPITADDADVIGHLSLRCR